MIDAALGSAGTVAKTVKEARSDLVAAEDDLDTATTAQSGLEERLKTATAELSYADVALSRCVREVVRADPAGAACVRRYIDAQVALNNLQQIIDFLGAPGPHSFLVEGTSLLPPRAQTDASAPWREWISDLRSDPDTPAPPI